MKHLPSQNQARVLGNRDKGNNNITSKTVLKDFIDDLRRNPQFSFKLKLFDSV